MYVINQYFPCVRQGAMTPCKATLLAWHVAVVALTPISHKERHQQPKLTMAYSGVQGHLRAPPARGVLRPDPPGDGGGRGAGPAQSGSGGGRNGERIADHS